MLVALLVCIVNFQVQRPVEPAPVVAQESLQKFTGTLEYIDEHGQKQTPHRGSVTLWRRWAHRWHVYEAQVVDGVVSVEMPERNIGIDIGRVVVDGREAYISHPTWPTMRWMARLAAPVHLAVVDAVTKALVSSFEVREHPGLVLPLDGDDGFTVMEHASGRVALPSWSVDPEPAFIPGAGWSPVRRFWIRAPECAWTSVVADFETGGDFTVELTPAAHLRVVLAPETRGVLGQRRPELEIALLGGYGWRRLGTAASALEFESLPAGEVTLRWVADDGRRGKPPIVSERTVELRAGQRTVVEF